MIKYIILFISLLYSYEIKPIPSATDFRIKKVLYVKDSPIEYIGTYGVESMITFDESEKIDKLIISDASAWSIKKLYDHVLLITPTEKNASTYMTIISNKNRVYYFLLKAKSITSYEDKDITLNLHITYGKNQAQTNEIPNQKKIKSTAKYYPGKKNKDTYKYVENIFEYNNKTYIKLKTKILFNVFVSNNINRLSWALPNWKLSKDNKYIIIDGIAPAVLLVANNQKFAFFRKNLVKENRIS